MAQPYLCRVQGIRVLGAPLCGRTPAIPVRPLRCRGMGGEPPNLCTWPWHIDWLYETIHDSYASGPDRFVRSPQP